MPTPVPPATFCKYLEKVPPLKLIEFVNREKAAEIRKIISKISSLAHFSQSMADYFARDDALEPALAVVCEVLRNTEDVGGVLKQRAATFLSLAQPYEKDRSSVDHDVNSEKSRNCDIQLCHVSDFKEACADGTIVSMFINVKNVARVTTEPTIARKTGTDHAGGKNLSINLADTGL